MGRGRIGGEFSHWDADRKAVFTGNQMPLARGMRGPSAGAFIAYSG
jgi:hypothetical protein